ncbi:MAG: flagellar basal body P-ring protein FlgI [Pirellulales bacterium]|nr:flagellar basal body P-ring protein FlgI [Pirellulales bacterium]
MRGWWIGIVTVALALAFAPSVDAGTRLKNICHIKGQEENTLQGLGLVVGLNGTGDGGAFLPAIRSLATALQLMGNPVGRGGALELKDARNVAIVMVTATVPGAGAREGELLDCQVSSIGSAKTLAGGRLFLTPLTGPVVENTRIYGFASGAIELDNPRFGATGRIHQGCRLEEDFFNAYQQDGAITLVLGQNHADFQIAQMIGQRINEHFDLQTGGKAIAQALNQGNVKVLIPPQNQEDPVDFIGEVMGLEVLLEAEIVPQSRVVINERTGSIVIDGSVKIGSVVVSHRNIVVEAGYELPDEMFVAVNPASEQTAELKSLVEALNAVKVPTDDIIDIIKGLERSGKLHARLIIE